MSEDIVANFDGAQPEDESVDTVSQTERVSRPVYGKPGWQEYVLSQLTEDEAVQVNGKIYPKCAGLRRLAEVLLGDIVFYGPTQIFPADSRGDSAGRASVLAEVHIVWTRAANEALWEGMELMPPRVFADASDVWEGNCAQPYVFHALATATTKALSRALKNALCLNVHTAEEMAGNSKYQSELVEEKQLDRVVEENVIGPATTPQLKFVEVTAKKVDVDADKLSVKMYEKPVAELNKSQASDLIKKLQEYQSAASNREGSIPDDIRV